MLKRLYFENFKSWQKLDLSFGQVTGLFGANSSGKSSILQFLLMLKQTKNAADRGLVLDFGGANELVNLGSFQDIIFEHDRDLKLSWKLHWSLVQEMSIADPTQRRIDVLSRASEITHKSVAHLRGKSLVSDHLEYGFDKFKFSISPKKTGDTEFRLHSESSENSDFRFVRNKARAWALPGPIKTHLFPDQAKTYYQNSEFLALFESEYEALLDSVFYLGPLRDTPRREYRWSGTSPTDVGIRGDQAIAAILSATSHKELRNFGGRTRYIPFQAMIAHWLKELGLIHDFKVEEIGDGANLYRAVVKRDNVSPTALLTDVGFGVSQVLPALVLLYYVPEGSTVLMEQPEIHLHPSVQSGLADVILAAASSRNLQVIVESHSEHLLRRFQRRVAEEKYQSGLIKLFFCANKDGKSNLEDLHLDLFGEIHNWPTHFFGDEMTEIAETRKRILKRKMVESGQ